MRTTAPRFDLRDWARLPERFPAELVDGFLVKDAAPTYGHQYVTTRIHAALLAVVGPARAPISPVDVVLDEHNVFQPDVVALRRVPARSARDVGVPLLAAEVLSHSTASLDRGRKRRRLVAAGVEVWLVDPESETIEVHDAAGSRCARGDEAIASRAVPEFSLVPSALFAAPE